MVTSDDVLSDPTLPQEAVFIGGGVIAMEFAHRVRTSRFSKWCGLHLACPWPANASRRPRLSSVARSRRSPASEQSCSPPRRDGNWADAVDVHEADATSRSGMAMVHGSCRCRRRSSRTGGVLRFVYASGDVTDRLEPEELVAKVREFSGGPWARRWKPQRTPTTAIFRGDPITSTATPAWGFDQSWCWMRRGWMPFKGARRQSHVLGGIAYTDTLGECRMTHFRFYYTGAACP
jgi:hypothetical protein